jgi:hypothetical protein
MPVLNKYIKQTANRCGDARGAGNVDSGAAGHIPLLSRFSNRDAHLERAGCHRGGW